MDLWLSNSRTEERLLDKHHSRRNHTTQMKSSVVNWPADWQHLKLCPLAACCAPFFIISICTEKGTLKAVFCHTFVRDVPLTAARCASTWTTWFVFWPLYHYLCLQAAADCSLPLCRRPLGLFLLLGSFHLAHISKQDILGLPAKVWWSIWTKNI